MAGINIQDFRIIPDDNFVASTYKAPGLFPQVGSTVEKIIVGRQIDNPNSILAFVTGDRAEQIEYVEGLVGIGVFLVCFVTIWLFTLLLLKLQGRERAGCAAGYAFRDTDRKSFVHDSEDESAGAAVGDDDSIAMDEPAMREQRQQKGFGLSSRLSSILGSYKSRGQRSTSTDEVDSDAPKEETNSNVPSDEENEVQNWAVFDERNLYGQGNIVFDNSQHMDEIELHMELDEIVRSTAQKHDDDKKVWTLRSLPPKSIAIVDETEKYAEVGIQKAWGKTCCCSPEPKHVHRRKVQTRCTFAFFAIVSLLSCVLLITHMYLPLESAALTSGAVVEDAAQIVDDLNEVLVVMEEAASVTSEIVETTPMQYEAICPNFPVENFGAQFGFNPNTIISTVSAEYQNYLPTIMDLLNTAKATSASVTDVLTDVNSAVSTTNEYLWIIPLIICVTILIIFSQLALMSAVVYKEYKFKGMKTTAPKVEDCYGWVVVPLQIFATLASWALVIAFCFGIIVTTDSCIPSFSFVESESASTTGRGTPEDTMLAFLDLYVDRDRSKSLIESLAYKRLSTYVTGCREDPLEELIMVQGLLQQSLEFVDTQVSFADNVLGLDFIQRQCGASNQVGLFFDNLSILNAQFEKVNEAIQIAYDAVSCPRVNALYVDAVHGALCTDFATSNTNGLILLIVISFSGMILITLRAAWRSSE